MITIGAIDDVIKMLGERRRENLKFIYHRCFFEYEHRDNIWYFPNDMLDKAENDPDGFIGSKFGIDCYLLSFLKPLDIQSHKGGWEI